MDRRKLLKRTGLAAGATIMAPTLLSLLQSCQSEDRLGWKPLFLDQDEAQTISALVDTILPTTETPGALDVNVDVFLDKLFAKTYDKKSQDKLRADLQTFNQECIDQYGDTFSSLTAADKQSFLQSAETKGGKFNMGVWGTAVGEPQTISFYRSLKSMAIWAYFSSEEIGKHVLNYDPIPQEYDGCKPVSEVGNRWTF